MVINIKKIFKSMIKMLLKIAEDILLIIGIILLSTGVFKIFIPAGYIVLGICFIAFAFFIAKKGG